MNTTSHQNSASKGVGVYPHDSADLPEKRTHQGVGDEKNFHVLHALFNAIFGV